MGRVSLCHGSYRIELVCHLYKPVRMLDEARIGYCGAERAYNKVEEQQAPMMPNQRGRNTTRIAFKDTHQT